MDIEFEKLFDTPVLTREKIYCALRDKIIWSRIPPESRLVETRLADYFGTSRTPVREALHLLEMEGLLEAIPRYGYRVKPIELDEVEEICELRVVNETLAARRAMQHITNKEIKALEDNLAGAEDMLKKNDSDGFIEMDATFHEILFRASNSKRLLEFCELLRRHMLRYLVISLGPHEAWKATLADHRQIANCLIQKDKKNIERAIKDHINHAQRDIELYVFGKEMGAIDRD